VGALRLVAWEVLQTLGYRVVEELAVQSHLWAKNPSMWM